MVIKHVNPLSAAKIGGIVGVLIGLIIGGCITFFALVIGGAAAAADGRPGAAIVSTLFGGAAIVILPIFYGVLTFVMTFIQVALYNLAAKWTGGVEVEVA